MILRDNSEAISAASGESAASITWQTTQTGTNSRTIRGQPVSSCPLPRFWRSWSSDLALCPRLRQITWPTMTLLMTFFASAWFSIELLIFWFSSIGVDTSESVLSTFADHCSLIPQCFKCRAPYTIHRCVWFFAMRWALPLSTPTLFRYVLFVAPHIWHITICKKIMRLLTKLSISVIFFRRFLRFRAMH